MAATAFAQSAPVEQARDSLPVPKNLENYNEFQVVKWGPVTYKGEGRCDILDLYQKNVADGLGYSTVVDYHSKEIKLKDKYSCESWGLGLAFSVVPDSNVNSENYGLRNNRATLFSARGKDQIKKLFAGDKYSCKYFGTAVVYKVKPNPFVEQVINYEDVVRKQVVSP